MWLDKDTIDKLCHEKDREKSFYQNCGGFALGIDSWYQLGPTVDWFNRCSSHCSKKGGWRDFERRCVRHILRDNPELHLISSDLIDEVSIDLDASEIIAFRIGRNWLGSYHFMRCEPNGDWTEKKGHSPYIYRHNYETIHEAWSKEYDGKEYFFVRERRA